MLELCCKQRLVLMGHMGQGVSHKVHFATLPARPQEAPADRRLEPLVAVGYAKPDILNTAFLEPFEEISVGLFRFPEHRLYRENIPGALG